MVLVVSVGGRVGMRFLGLGSVHQPCGTGKGIQLVEIQVGVTVVLLMLVLAVLCVGGVDWNGWSLLIDKMFSLW